MKYKKKDSFATYANALTMGALLVAWCIICLYPATWHITSDGACYRRYGTWRASSSGVGDFTLPFYDALHKTNYPTHNAVLRDNITRLTSIPKDQLNPNQLDNFGMTPLAYAARSGLKDALHYLLSNGANPDIKTFRDMTALLLAVNHERRELALMLLEFGADASIAGLSGVTPAHLAAEKNYDTVLAKISELGYSLDIKDAKGLTPLDYAIKKGAMKATIQLAASGAECSFLLSPRNDNIALFLKRWQEAGVTPFTMPVMAESDINYGRTIREDSIPAELPVNVKPHTFINRGE